MTLAVPLRLKLASEAKHCRTVSKGGDREVAQREIYDMMGIRFKDHPDLDAFEWDGYPYFRCGKNSRLPATKRIPDVAFTIRAPMEVVLLLPCLSTKNVKDREPRARRVEDEM